MNNVEEIILESARKHTVFEGMTSISAVINSIKAAKTDATAYDRRIISVLFDKSKTSSKHRELAFLRRNSEILGYELHLCDADLLDRISSGATHGGILAICSDRTIPKLTVDKISSCGFYALIEGIEDPFNFGYSIRSLYAAGVDGIILTPRNWMSAAGIVAKHSAGTSELLPAFYAESSEVASIFHSLDYKVVCAGIRDSVSLYEADLKKPILLVVGGEKRGISRSLLDSSDTVVRIDYARDFKGSLTTSSAVSVIAFEISRQNSK